MIDLLFCVALLIFCFVMLVFCGVVMIVGEIARLITEFASLIFDYVMAVLDWIDDIDFLMGFAFVITTLFYIVLAPFAILKWTYDGIIAGVYYAATGLNKLIGGKEKKEYVEYHLFFDEAEKLPLAFEYKTIDGDSVPMYRYRADNVCVVKHYYKDIYGRGKTFSQAEYAFVIEYRHYKDTLPLLIR